MAKTVHSKVVVSAKDNVSPTLDKMQTRFRVFARTAQRFGRTFQAIGAVSLVSFAGGLTASIAAAKNAVGVFSEYGTAVDNTSRSLSIAADSLQGFRYAAELGGSSASEMDGAIAMLNKNMANAAAGNNKNLVKLMSDLGISMKDANGKMKTAAELMPEIADCIKSQSNATQKAYIATQFFGRSGQNLIKTLNDGSEGLYKARAEAEKFGLVLSKEDVAAATAFGDSMTRTEKAITGVKLSIGSKLMPLLQPMIDNMNDWIAANREWIATAITDVINNFANSLKNIDFKSIINNTVNLIKRGIELFNTFGGLKSIAIALGAILGGQFIVGLVSTCSAFASIIGVIWPLIKATWAFNAALMANPLTWIILGIVAAIALLAGAVYMIYDNWGAISEWFSQLWTKISDGATEIFESFTNYFTKTIPDKVMSAWEKLKSWFLNLIDSMLGPAMKIVDTVSNVTGAIGDGISSAWDSVTGFFGGNNDSQLQAVPVGGALPSLIDNRFSGAMEIRLKSDAGTTAEVTEARTDNNAVSMRVTQDRGASR